MFLLFINYQYKKKFKNYFSILKLTYSRNICLNLKNFFKKNIIKNSLEFSNELVIRLI